jgi:hypothetical protein
MIHSPSRGLAKSECLFPLCSRHIISLDLTDFFCSIRDHVPHSELSYLSPVPKETVPGERHVKDHALLRDVVNVIPQVAEEREQEDLAEQITLAHRRYVLAAGAELKKLVVKDEQSKQIPAPYYIAPQTALLPSPCVSHRPSPRMALEHRRAPRVRKDQNTIAPMVHVKSRRRMAILDNGALSHKLNAMLGYRVASKGWT